MRAWRRFSSPANDSCPSSHACGTPVWRIAEAAQAKHARAALSRHPPCLQSARALPARCCHHHHHHHHHHCRCRLSCYCTRGCLNHRAVAPATWWRAHPLSLIASSHTRGTCRPEGQQRANASRLQTPKNAQGPTRCRPCCRRPCCHLPPGRRCLARPLLLVAAVVVLRKHCHHFDYHCCCCCCCRSPMPTLHFPVRAPVRPLSAAGYCMDGSVPARALSGGCTQHTNPQPQDQELRSQTTGCCSR